MYDSTCSGYSYIVHHGVYRTSAAGGVGVKLVPPPHPAYNYIDSNDSCINPRYSETSLLWTPQEPQKLSLFQGLICTLFYYIAGTRASVLIREVSLFQRSLIERFHCKMSTTITLGNYFDSYLRSIPCCTVVCGEWLLIVVGSFLLPFSSPALIGKIFVVQLFCPMYIAQSLWQTLPHGQKLIIPLIIHVSIMRVQLGWVKFLPSEKYRLYSMHVHVCRMKVESTVILRWLGSKIH